MRLLLILILLHSSHCLINVQGVASFKNFKLPSFISSPSFNKDRIQKEQELLRSIQNTSNGKNASPEKQIEVLSIVSYLESSFPAPPLNSILEPGSILDGNWYLQYTSPSDIKVDSSKASLSESIWTVEQPEEKIETKQFNAKGSVSAAGIEVDVTYKTPKQIFNLSDLTVRNEVILNKSGLTKVTVGGPFRLSSKKSNRAVVSFLFGTLELIFLGKTVFLDLAPVFRILAVLRGTDESGWLETTYLSDSIRIGRGNKGTMFILTRNEEIFE